MARKPRIHFPGAFYHCLLRGNGGQDIYFSDSDRTKFYLLLQQGVERYRHRIHAFCCMTNHIHLVIQVGEIPLSRIIQNLSFRYTRYINGNLGRIGHLFQGRYKALVIDADSYLLDLVRYVHLNPVRASLTDQPHLYLWSSHGCYLGERNISWLTTDFVLGQFSEDERKARTQYEQFIKKDLGGSRRQEFYSGTHEGRILGSDLFVEKALTVANEEYQSRFTLEQVLQVVAQEFGIVQSQLSSSCRYRKLSQARAVTAFLVNESSHLSLTDLARCLNRDLSGLSQAAGRLHRRLGQDRDLDLLVKEINNKLSECP